MFLMYAALNLVYLQGDLSGFLVVIFISFAVSLQSEELFLLPSDMLLLII